MKPTPRTDAAIGRIDGVAYRADAHSFAPVIEECQTLERDLSDALDALARVRAEEREACATILDEAAIRLFAGKKRVNQVDQHVAGVLRDKAAAIRARTQEKP